MSALSTVKLSCTIGGGGSVTGNATRLCRAEAAGMPPRPQPPPIGSAAGAAADGSPAARGAAAGAAALRLSCAIARSRVAAVRGTGSR